MKKSLTIIVLALIACLATAQPQSVTFEVDKDLSAPKTKLQKYDDKEIAKQIVNISGIPQKLHHVKKTSFEGERLCYLGDDHFFKCMVQAYADHRPLVLSPDMVWLIISQGFSRYVNAHTEEMRDLLVFHEGKMELVVNSDNNILLPNGDWERLLNDFSDCIAKNTKGELSDLMTADFTTTGITERIASQVSLMDVVKKYFIYSNIAGVCGIPSITLKGSPDDWQKVLDKVRCLKKYHLKKWVSDLEPILKEFVKASKGKANKKFWQNIVKKIRVDQMKSDRGCLPDPKKNTHLDGWFLKFFPNTEGKTDDSVIWNAKMPQEMVRVSFRHILTHPVTGEPIDTIPMQLWAGFVGVEEDAKTRALTPKIGWLARIADEESDEVARQDDSNNIDSVLIVVNGKPIQKSMNYQLIKPRHQMREYDDISYITVDEALKGRIGPANVNNDRHFDYDLGLERDLRAYFLRRDQYVSDVKVLKDAAATAIYGRNGANGAIEITTRPFLSVAPLSPDESKARRLKFLQNIYDNYFAGHTIGTNSVFGPDGFIYNGKDHAFNPDLFDTPVEEQFFGQLTYQHGHKTSEFLGPLGSDPRGIYVPLIREVEIMLPAKVDQNHVDSVVNAIRQAAKQADKSIERTDSLVRLAFIFEGKVKEGKPHPFRTYPMKKNGSSDIESRYYFTPDANAESSWWAETCFSPSHPRQLVMHLISVDKLYASDHPAILENRRHVEGTVLDDETGTPLADALVYIETTMGISDAGGVRTDMKGHFDLWLPFHNDLVRVSKSGYKDAYWIQPTDTALTIRLIPVTSPTERPFPIKGVITVGNGVNTGDTISGIVRDHHDVPLVGATVCERNEKGRIVSAAITDHNGRFTLKIVNTNNQLRFSYVGCRTEIIDINGVKYDVRLQPVK